MELVAHRGADESPENTLLALERASRRLAGLPVRRRRGVDGATGDSWTLAGVEAGTGADAEIDGETEATTAD